MNTDTVTPRDCATQVFASPDGIPLSLDLFLPANQGQPIEEPLPAIIFVHGGGFRFGDRTLGPDFSRFFAQAGFATVSVDYRLSTHAVYPAAIEDVQTAVRAVAEMGPERGIDPERIGLWGSSAGGYLALMAVMQDASLPVRALVNGYGPIDFLTMDEERDPTIPQSDDPESIRLPAGKQTGDADSLESLFMGAPIGSIPDRVRAASPLAHIRPGLPPILTLHGTSDAAVPVQQSERLHAALTEGHSPSTLARIDRLGHGFFNRSHLDDSPHRITLTGTGGYGLNPDNGQVFGLVETFFRATLVGSEA